MSQVILVTGGARSGKSDFAMQQAESLHQSGDKIFLATCPHVDEETSARITQHKEERRGLGWQTIEEETAIAKKLQTIEKPGVVLIDCLTLWINNLLFHNRFSQQSITEQDVAKRILEILEVSEKRSFDLVCVTGEVGMGIVPDNQQARLYRDLVGRCNRIFAAHSDRAYLMSCGLPITLK